MNEETAVQAAKPERQPKPKRAEATNQPEQAGPRTLPFDPSRLERPVERTSDSGKRLKVWDVVPGDPDECRKRDEWLATVGKAHFDPTNPPGTNANERSAANADPPAPKWSGPLDGACYVGYPFAAWHHSLESLGGIGLLKVGLAKDCSCGVYVRTDQWRAA